SQATLTVSGKSRRDQRHTRAKIATVERATAQASGSGDDDPVRVAEEQVSAHPAQLLEREQPQLVHPIVDQRLAVTLRGEHGHEAHEVTWEARPQARRDPPSRSQFGRWTYMKDAVFERTGDLHPGEDGRDDLHVFRACAEYLDFAASHGSHHCPT